MTGLTWASLRTPVGQLSVGCSQAGVARIRYDRPTVPPGGERGAAARSGTNQRVGTSPADQHTGGPHEVLSSDQHAVGPHEVLPPDQHSGAAVLFAETARAELLEFFYSGRRTFDVPVDWAATAGPQRQVLTVLAETVGYGETISYGALARRAGLPIDPASARAVGSIMAANPVPIIVPCHRVLASDGLGGYSGGEGVEVKRWLLVLEGSQPPTLDWDARGVWGSASHC